jgi:hypothetical protein
LRQEWVVLPQRGGGERTRRACRDNRDHPADARSGLFGGRECSLGHEGRAKQVSADSLTQFGPGIASESRAFH